MRLAFFMVDESETTVDNYLLPQTFSEVQVEKDHVLALWTYTTNKSYGCKNIPYRDGFYKLGGRNFNLLQILA